MVRWFLNDNGLRMLSNIELTQDAHWTHLYVK